MLISAGRRAEIIRLIQKVPGYNREIRSLSVLKGDASSRSYLRIQLESPHSSCLRSLVCMVREPLPSAQWEFLAVHRLLCECAIPVPELFYADAEHGLLLMQDLGDRLLESAVLTEREEVLRWRYQDLILLMIEMQSRVTRAMPAGHFVAGRRFDIEKLLWELHFFRRHALEEHFESSFNDSEWARIEDFFIHLAERMQSAFEVFCHRDYHSRNILEYRDQYFLIDFQDARMGPEVYDLASLLRDAYVELSEPFIAEMFEFYVRHRPAWYPNLVRPQIEELWWVTSMQRLLKAVGTFGFQYRRRKNTRYLPALDRAVRQIFFLFENHPEWNGIKELLQRATRQTEPI